MLEPAPRAFEVYIGGFGGRAYGVWWDGSRLVYESFLAGYKERQQTFVSPSRAQWNRFWRTMDRIGVWDWRAHYERGKRLEPLSGSERDGTYWSLTLAHGDRAVESSGGGGPGSADLDESASFGAFAEAVSRLVGGHAFN